MTTRCCAISVLLLTVAITSFAQKKTVTVCKQPVFAALKPLPKLEYECPEGLTESDDKLLTTPARLKVIRAIEKELAGFTNPVWWSAAIDDLAACEIHGSAGPLTDEEKEKLSQGDYQYQLFGNGEVRLALLPDSCYQVGYNGSSAFLLYRKGGVVTVTQVLKGYYSRADNSVSLHSARMNGQLIVEVATGNSMPPSLVSYFFAIDPKTNKAVPKRIFKEGSKLTNKIYSDMLMDEPKSLGLPADAAELNIIRHDRLAPRFSAYQESERGKIDAQGRTLRRIVYRWNGRFYIAK